MKEISVIIPNYNSGKYIKKCIEALLQQEYPVNEIIIIDDCSSDESKDIIQEYKNNNDKIIFIKNKENKGVSFSRNIGIEAAKSEYIMFCDADDWYEKDATRKMINCLNEYGADFIIAGYYITYNYDKKIEIKYDELFKNNVISKEECISCLPITSSAKLIKKSIFLNNNIKYPEGIKNCEELAVIPIVAFNSEKVVYLNECIYNYYQKENSASNKMIKDLSFYDITYEKFCKNLPNKYKEAINIRMVEHLLYSKTFSLIKAKFNKKEIVASIRKCKEYLSGQNFNKILKSFPIRKRIFLLFALAEIIFPLKLYVKLQLKILKN